MCGIVYLFCRNRGSASYKLRHSLHSQQYLSLLFFFNFYMRHGSTNPSPCVFGCGHVVLFAQNKKLPSHYAVNRNPVPYAVARALQMAEGVFGPAIFFFGSPCFG